MKLRDLPFEDPTTSGEKHGDGSDEDQHEAEQCRGGVAAAVCELFLLETGTTVGVTETGWFDVPVVEVEGVLTASGNSRWSEPSAPAGYPGGTVLNQVKPMLCRPAVTPACLN